MKKSIAVLVNLMPLSSKSQSQEEIQNVLLIATSFQKKKKSAITPGRIFNCFLGSSVFAVESSSGVRTQTGYHFINS